jgi:hypothetical protein
LCRKPRSEATRTGRRSSSLLESPGCNGPYALNANEGSTDRFGPDFIIKAGEVGQGRRGYTINSEGTARMIIVTSPADEAAEGGWGGLIGDLESGVH